VRLLTHTLKKNDISLFALSSAGRAAYAAVDGKGENEVDDDVSEDEVHDNSDAEASDEETPRSSAGVDPAAHLLTSSAADTGVEANDESGMHEVLMSALQRKCDQFMELQLAYQNQQERLFTTEKELEQREVQLTDLAEDPDLKIRTLEDKLAAAEKLCKKLLESGLYWRQQRRNRTDRVVVPIQGGGGKRRPSVPDSEQQLNLPIPDDDSDQNKITTTPTHDRELSPSPSPPSISANGSVSPNAEVQDNADVQSTPEVEPAASPVAHKGQTGTKASRTADASSHVAVTTPAPSTPSKLRKPSTSSSKLPAPPREIFASPTTNPASKTSDLTSASITAHVPEFLPADAITPSRASSAAGPSPPLNTPSPAFGSSTRSSSLSRSTATSRTRSRSMTRNSLNGTARPEYDMTSAAAAATRRSNSRTRASNSTTSASSPTGSGSAVKRSSSRSRSSISTITGIGFSKAKAGPEGSPHNGPAIDSPSASTSVTPTSTRGPPAFGGSGPVRVARVASMANTTPNGRERETTPTAETSKSAGTRRSRSRSITRKEDGFGLFF
jgi:hypothetical protein